VGTILPVNLVDLAAAVVALNNGMTMPVFVCPVMLLSFHHSCERSLVVFSGLGGFLGFTLK